jgi:uncharacterized phage protein (TIGR02220 family)
MAIYRNVHLTFWEDSKIYDDFTPEDKYFMLWLLTNPKTNMIGCYEISFKKAQSELGYTTDVIQTLISRLQEKHDTIIYDKSTREILIRNWYKYNWTSSEKLDKPIINAINKIKSLEFKKYMVNIYKNQKRKIPYTYPIDTTDPDTVTDNDVISDIINYLNEKIKSNYKPTTDKTKTLIRARIKEGFNYNDFEIVIDKKTLEWLDTEMQSYLRPETLFGTKFESYLNQLEVIKPNSKNSNERLTSKDVTDW